MYGLKGNIDATVQVSCREKDEEKNLVVPLELKTGKRDTNQAHRAQTALYTLLLTDRYGEFVCDVKCMFVCSYYNRCRGYLWFAVLYGGFQNSEYTSCPP